MHVEGFVGRKTDHAATRQGVDAVAHVFPAGSHVDSGGLQHRGTHRNRQTIPRFGIIQRHPELGRLGLAGLEVVGHRHVKRFGSIGHVQIEGDRSTLGNRVVAHIVGAGGPGAGFEPLNGRVVLVLPPHPFGIGDLIQQVLPPTPVEKPVEGVKTIGAVSPQVGGAPSNDLIRTDAVAVPVTVETGIDGELARLHQASKLAERRQLGQPLPQDQHVCQILVDPLFNFKAAELAPFDLLRDADGNLDGPAPAAGLLIEALPDGAHELGQVFSVLSLGTPLEIERVSQPVQLDAVKIPAIEKLLGHFELQGPDSGMSEVQGRPPVEIVHQPVGIDPLEGGQFRVGQGASGVLTVVGVIHP